MIILKPATISGQKSAGNKLPTSIGAIFKKPAPRSTNRF